MEGVVVNKILMRPLFCLCSLGLLGFIAGCNPELHKQAEAMPIERDISVQELAANLKLPLVECNQSLARLGDNGNAVTIYAKPSGSVYVNGQEIATAADITSANGTLILPAELEEEIRLSLHREPPVKPYKPVKPKIKPTKNTPEPIRNIGVVIIDPGHGGKDPGAINGSGHQEKKVNLAVSKMVKTILADNNVSVHMTRDKDVFVELDERVNICNRIKPDLFVSIHADACRNRQVKGFTVYVPKREKAGSPSHQAGSRVAGQMKKIATSKGVQQHSVRLRVLENTRHPAMLIELGYMSNRYEAALLKKQNYREQLARAIADGILQYLRGQ